MQTKRTYVFAGAFALLACSAPLMAQNQAGQTAGTSAASTTWNEQQLRNGISVDRLVGTEVRGRNGNDIGDVAHVLINDRGKVTGIIVQSGGFMNIGDTRFRIPWNEVQLGRDMNFVTVPLTEQTAERYRDTKDDNVRTGAREFRVSTVKDGSVTLRDGTQYGQIHDLIMTRDGEIKAVIADGSFGPGGVRAIPFDAATFDFDRNTFRAPYDRTQVGEFRPFDYRGSGVAEPRERGTGATGAGGAGGVGSGEQDRGNLPARQSRG